MKIKLFSGLVIVSLVIVILAGCSPATTTSISTTNTSVTTTTASDTPQYGGIYRTISPYSPTNIGVPYEPAPGPDMTAGYPVIETLLRMDKKGLPVPWLATGWSNDAKSLTLNLRQGVKFHDGTDFNAESVKYNLDQYRTGILPELKSVTSVDVVDNYTVKLNFPQYSKTILYSLFGRAGLMASPTALKANPKEYNRVHPVGTGPFKFESFQKDVSLKLVKFPGYWQKGKPYLDAIELVIVADPTIAIMSFESGECHAVSADADTATKYLASGQFRVTSFPVSVSCLFGDSANPTSPFSKLEVRQAVSYALDTAGFAKAFGKGFWDATNQLAPPGSSNYNSAVVGYPYNPAKAKELLTAAGYPDGFPMKLSCSTASIMNRTVPALQSYLNAVGLKTEIESISTALFSQRQAQGWNNSLFQVNFPVQLGIDFTQTYAQFLGKGPQYVSVTHPDEIESILGQALVETDAAKAAALNQQIMKLTIDKYCLVSPIVATNPTFATSKRVHNANVMEFWYYQWTPEETWLSK